MAAIGYQVLLGQDSSDTGTLGVLTAIAGAVAFVTGMVAWIAAVVIALRSGSMLWLVVAVLPIVPINALVCAMFCPAAPPEKRR